MQQYMIDSWGNFRRSVADLQSIMATRADDLQGAMADLARWRETFAESFPREFRVLLDRYEGYGHDTHDAVALMRWLDSELTGVVDGGHSILNSQDRILRELSEGEISELLQLVGADPHQRAAVASFVELQSSTPKHWRYGPARSY